MLARLLLVLLLCVGGCWSRMCDDSSRVHLESRLPRRMLQQDVVSLNFTVDKPIEVGNNVQLCRTSFNTYFYPFANGNRQLADPLNNLKASSKECCASCLQNKQCNSWQWCPVEVGCSFANTTGKALSNTTFPYLGCQLLRLEGFSEYLFNLTDVKSTGETIPFIAGAPLNTSLKVVPGYDYFPGNELGSQFDFPCDLTDLAVSTGNDTTPGELVIKGPGLVEYNSSSEFGCMVKGSADKVASVCSAITSCQAFSYYEKGLDPTGLSLEEVPINGSVGILKTGDLENAFVTALELNPNSIVYVKSGVLPDSASALSDPVIETTATEESGGGSSTVTIAVVSSVVGVIVIIGLVVMVYYVRRYQQMTKSFPSPPNSGTHSAQDTPNGMVQGSPYGKAAGLSVLTRNHVSSDDTTGDDVDESIVESDTPGSTTAKNPSPSRMTHNGFLVSEVSLPTAPTSQIRDSAPTSATNGSSARALMDAFSQMYKQRPTVDYGQFGSLLEDDESRAVAELEAAVEESRKSNTNSSATNERSSRIPSAIAKESTGLMDAGLVDDWSILPEEVEVCRRPDGTWWQLGTGGYGTVYKGLYHGIHPVAIKIIHHIEEDRHKDSFIREASLLKALRHKNVVQFLGASLDGPQGTALLVTELMELGDLWRALSAKDSTGERIFSWYNRGAQCMMDVANGLHYLHTKRVVHFDLKSANILLSKAGTAKLADIGMARVLNKSYLSVISGLGTFAWSAPEVLAGKRCTEKADIYSWGVVLWEICTGEAPARGDMRPLQAPDDCPPTIVELYEQCVAENPDDRPSATQVLEILNSLL